MAAPVYSVNKTLVDAMNGSAMIAPQLESAQTPATLQVQQNASGYEQVSASIGLWGARFEFSLPADATAFDWVSFQLHYYSYGSMARCATFAAGGLRVLLFDSLGNWVRFNINGSDLYGNDADGGFRVYRLVLQSDQVETGSIFYINKNAIPDAVSGVFDWSDIAGVELHQSVVTVFRINMYMAVFKLANPPIMTRGEIANPSKVGGMSSVFTGTDVSARSWHTGSQQLSQASSRIYIMHSGLIVGDGVSDGYSLDSNFELAFQSSRAAIEESVVSPLLYGCAVTDLPGISRKVFINLGASHDLDWSNFRVTAQATSTGDGSFVVAGSGSCSFDVGAFTGLKDVDLAHSVGNRLTFDKCLNVIIGLSAVVQLSNIKNVPAAGKSLYFTGGPGDYSGCDVFIENSIAGNDITIADGSAGIYDLSGLSAGHTINIHNESVSSAITVKLDSSVSATFTTAGGAVTIDNALTVDVTVTVKDQETGALVEGAVVFLESDTGGSIAAGTVILSATTGADGIATTSLSVSGGSQPIRGRVRKASASPFYRNYPLSGAITAAGYSNTVLLVRED